MKQKHSKFTVPKINKLFSSLPDEEEIALESEDESTLEFESGNDFCI